MMKFREYIKLTPDEKNVLLDRNPTRTHKSSWFSDIAVNQFHKGEPAQRDQATSENGSVISTPQISLSQSGNVT
jgi:hypothetical protein